MTATFARARAPIAPGARSAGLSVLVLICAAQFLVVADDTIVNIALASIKADLGFDEATLAWVVNAYLLMFGGFLLVGGRAVDLLGRRRVFMAGAVMFTLVSLACGLAPTQETLIVARALQGLTGALLSPAALSILMATYPEGPARTRALGAWGAVMGLAGATGVLLGGVITDLLDWRWVFFINIPAGIALFTAASRLLPADGERSRGALDLHGALLVTSALLLLLFTIVETRTEAWTSWRTVGGLAVSAALLGWFALHESRTEAPLLPGVLLRRRAALAAFGLLFLGAAALFAMFFFVSLYMQQVKGFSPVEAGVAWMPFSAGLLVTSGVLLRVLPGSRLRPFLVAGALTTAAGFAWLTALDAGDAYWSGLAPAMVGLGIGVGLLLVPTTAAATSGVGEAYAGLAAGLITTFQQIGGAVGLAVLVTVSTDRSETLLGRGESAVEATAGGYAAAYWVAVGLTVTAALVSLALGPMRAPKEITPV